jgi:hypothetical protein
MYAVKNGKCMDKFFSENTKKRQGLLDFGIDKNIDVLILGTVSPGI